MKFTLKKSMEVLSQTPYTVASLLGDLGDEWLLGNEGENTWNPYEVMGHLIHTEKTNWVPRLAVILSVKEDRTFPPFDRFAQLNDKAVPLSQLLKEFKVVREQNLQLLASKNLTEEHLVRKGHHPQLGEVTLAQLLATWTVHDLTHLSQIIRVMAHQYKEEVGPWIVNLRVLRP